MLCEVGNLACGHGFMSIHDDVQLLVAAITMGRTGSAAEGFIKDMKCWSHFRKASFVIHPLGVGKLMFSAGAPIIRWLFILFRGKIKSSRINCPYALIHSIRVHYDPSLQMSFLPIWHFPFIVITLSFSCIHETSVSWLLKIQDKRKKILSKRFCNLLNKTFQNVAY